MTKAEHARIVAWRLRILQHAEGEPGKSFYDYTAKQQAMIVQTWFEDPAKRIVPEYRRLIEQVRSLISASLDCRPIALKAIITDRLTMRRKSA